MRERVIKTGFRTKPLFALLGGIFIFNPLAMADPALQPTYVSGEAAIEQHDYDAAIGLFNQRIAKTHDDAEAYSGRGECYALKQEYAKAITDYTEFLRLRPRFAQAYASRAEAYTQLADYDRAIADYTTALNLRPSRDDLYFDRGKCFAIQERYVLAIQDFTQALFLNSANSPALKARADAFLHLGSGAEALSDINEALSTGGDLGAIRVERSNILGKRGEYEKSIEAARELIHLHPGASGGYNTVAWRMAICPENKFWNKEKAMEYATRACELAWWKGSNELDTYAAVLARSGRFDEAIQWEQKSLFEVSATKLVRFQQRLRLYQAHQTYREPEFEVVDRAWDDLRHETFDLIWRTVNEEYLDPALSDKAWTKVREAYRVRLVAIKNEDGLRSLLQEMLGELHQTHFSIIPRTAAVFSPEERTRQGTVGARVEVLDGRVFISKIIRRSSADQNGLKLGDEILSVDGISIDSVRAALSKASISPARAGLYIKESLETRLSGKVGTRVVVTVSDLKETHKKVSLDCRALSGQWSDPVGNFPSVPIDIETGYRGRNVGYLRFNVFTLPVIAPAKKFLLKLGSHDGLIIDLRDNPGGEVTIAAGLCGWLSGEELTLGLMHLRDQDVPLAVYPQEHAFLGPIAVLIDAGSASTSEVLASGLKDARRARLFGQTTAGAALPSQFKRLPNGDLLQYAVGDIRTPSGQLIEGNGVVPDDSVMSSRAGLVTGQDLVLDAAKAWLRKQPNPLPTALSH